MKRILIIDDEYRIRRIYTNLLTMEGFDVIEASNAIDAHEILKRSVIDLVLLDIKMPKINGSEMFDVIDQFHKQVKLIVISVYPLFVQKQAIPGANDYFDKSQSIEMLLKKIRLVLDDKTKKQDF